MKEAAYKLLGRAHPEGLEPIDRRVLRDLHPDKPQNRERMSSADFKEKLDALRNGYAEGREEYLMSRPNIQVEALQRNSIPEVALDANHMADVSTHFHYDSSVLYHPSMGDVFYHTPTRTSCGAPRIEQCRVTLNFRSRKFREVLAARRKS
jgi:hypothetical protein